MRAIALFVQAGCVAPATPAGVATEAAADAGRPLWVPLPGSGGDGACGDGAAGGGVPVVVPGGTGGAGAVPGEAMGADGGSMAAAEDTGGAGVAWPLDGGLPRPDAALPHEPAGPPPPDAPGQVVISEWLANPVTLGDTEGEWVELSLVAGSPRSLDGCSLLGDGDGSDALPDGLELSVEDPIVVARRGMPGFVPDAVIAISLRNESDMVALRCGGVEIDRIVYGPQYERPAIPGVSTQRDPASFDGEAVFCAARSDYNGDLGSPGTLNASCGAEPQDAGVH